VFNPIRPRHALTKRTPITRRPGTARGTNAMRMSPFARYLGLIDETRDSLEPDPVADPELYVDLDGLVEKCVAHLARRAPKLVLMGDYGTGKTHLLNVLMHEVDADRFETVYLKLEPVGKWAESRHLHQALLSALERKGRLRSALEAVDAARAGVDVQRAFQMLAAEPDNADVRAWLLSTGPTPAKARKLGFSAPLSAIARGVQYAEIWAILADGFRKAVGREILFLIDEAETFQEQVDQSRAADLGVAVREMFDAGNRSYGVIMGLTAPKARRDPFSLHPLGRPDVASRVQNVFHQMLALGTPDRRTAFVSGILDKLAGDWRDIIAPDGLEALAANGPRWASAQVLLAREPVQREYVKLLDRIARAAFERALALPLSAADLAALLDGAA
jgi:hypothetical protein